MKQKVNENLNYVDMFNKDFFLVRIPFLKDYKFFNRKNGVEAQRVIFHEDLTKLYNGEIIKFKQFNVSSEFIFYAQRIDDRTFYHFTIKNQFHPMLYPSQLDGLEEKVLFLAIKQIGEKLSYSDEIMVKDNQSIDENKLDEIFNKINEILFKVEEDSKENNTPLFEGNTIKGGKSDKMSAKDIANKFKVSVDKIQSQIKKGIKIEMEHTGDKEKATEIAMDHLTEFPDYYDRLEKMETTAKKEFDINENSDTLDNDWAIFKISNGEKCFITKLGHRNSFENCHYDVKYSDNIVLKFSLEQAKSIIKKNIFVGDKLGVVNQKGVQKLFDWRIKHNDVNESQKVLIKKLLREELEEGNFAKTLGTLGMAASTLASPNMSAMNKDPYKIEKSDKIGVVVNNNGTVTSIARTDGPTKEMAQELAIGKAKIQIVSKLNLESPNFNFEIVDVKFEKGKGNIICTVQIVARIK